MTEYTHCVTILAITPKDSGIDLAEYGLGELFSPIMAGRQFNDEFVNIKINNSYPGDLESSIGQAFSFVFYNVCTDIPMRDSEDKELFTDTRFYTYYVCKSDQEIEEHLLHDLPYAILTALGIQFNQKFLHVAELLDFKRWVTVLATEVVNGISADQVYQRVCDHAGAFDAVPIGHTPTIH